MVPRPLFFRTNHGSKHMDGTMQTIVTPKEALSDPSNHILVVTGAGISAESGVPTFRGAGETWQGRHFTELASPEAFAENPRLIWDWYLYRRNVVTTCSFNAAHHAIAERARRVPGSITLVTQNVDDLHEQAGYPGHVTHYHGSLWHNRCTACGVEREERYLTYEMLPMSPCCGAPERPAIVWFGEGVSKESFCRAQIGLLQANVVLLVGTSGAVNTAVQFASLAMSRDILTVFVNLEDVPIPRHYFVQGRAGELLPELLGLV